MWLGYDSGTYEGFCSIVTVTQIIFTKMALALKDAAITYEIVPSEKFHRVCKMSDLWQ
jgi:hypothetical protein